MTLPGALLLHEGQFEGRKVRLPVFLGRRPDESPDNDLQAFYHTLLGLIAKEGLRNGEWLLCERVGWFDNQSCLNLVAWCWQDGNKRHIVVVNLSDQHSQGQVRLPWDELSRYSWELCDLLTGAVYMREPRTPGNRFVRRLGAVELPSVCISQGVRRTRYTGYGNSE